MKKFGDVMSEWVFAEYAKVHIALEAGANIATETPEKSKRDFYAGKMLYEHTHRKEFLRLIKILIYT